MEENPNNENNEQENETPGQDVDTGYPLRPRLRKSADNRIIFGVCGGIGEYFNVDPFIIRLLFLVSIFFGGWGIVIYLIASIAIPPPQKEEAASEFDISRLKAFSGFTLIFFGIYLLLSKTRFLFNSFFGFSYQLFIPFILFTLGIFFFLTSLKENTAPVSSKLLLSKDDFRIAGVCGGLAKYLGSDSFLVRFQWVIFTIFSFGAGILVYILFMFTVPKEEIDFASKD